MKLNSEYDPCPLCDKDGVVNLVRHVFCSHTEKFRRLSGFGVMFCICGRDFAFENSVEAHWDERGGLAAHFLECTLGRKHNESV